MEELSSTLETTVEMEGHPESSIINPKTCDTAIIEFAASAKQKSKPAICTLPREVRDMMFGYLLLNPILSTPESIETMDNHRSSPNFSLSVTILRTCQQFYHERSEALYGKNTIYCAYGLSALRRSPVHTVRKWKLVIGTSAHEGSSEENALDILWDFYQAIATAPKQLVEVAIFPNGVSFHPRFDILVDRALQPLGLLRATKHVLFSSASLSEISFSIIFERKSAIIFECFLDHKELLITQTTALMQSNDQLEIGNTMYALLLTYARSFEQYTPFQYDMDINPSPSPGGITDGIQLEPSSKFGRKNPFKGERTHPVEEGLMAAKAAALVNDLEEFKMHQNFVLTYLEAQYQRIEFDIDDYHNFRDWYQEAVEVLEERLIAIRQARNAILSKDIKNDPGCRLTLQVPNLDERIDWRIMEPNMSPSPLW
ncbi:hypothetical protein IFR05_002997 [Cadophora sp. M221]|nr:hypothetical protein IFR05_002997 [Cadophora sp. M221]